MNAQCEVLQNVLIICHINCRERSPALKSCARRLFSCVDSANNRQQINIQYIPMQCNLCVLAVCFFFAMRIFNGAVNGLRVGLSTPIDLHGLLLGFKYFLKNRSIFNYDGNTFVKSSIGLI